MNDAIEVVVFRAMAGPAPQQLQAAAAAVSPFLAALPQFITREFGAPNGGDNQCIDVVYWRDRSAPKRCHTDSDNGATVSREYLDLLEQGTTQLVHLYRVA